MAVSQGSSLLKKVTELEQLDISYDQRELLSTVSESLINLYNATKPYNHRHIYHHSVTDAHKYTRYVFNYPIQQIVVMPVPANISLLLDNDDASYALEEGESLNMTTQATEMAISNSANPTITEKVRIYVFGRK